ncbi:universal stress protein [Kitasatospora sp. NPDC002227]|uniref:universal stress protein n=1 Tax=Kitasatospora sp. NPDC002227 TaxID=3154773 RepID=UPI003324349D
MNSLEQGAVVVGVGRLTAGRPALAWAAEEAARTGRALRLVHALEHPQDDGEAPGLLAEHLRAGGDVVLAQARKLVEEWQPEVVVEPRAVAGRRAPVLLAEAADAALLVVGAKHRPVVEQVLALPPLAVPLSSHARCPVAVVHEDAAVAVGRPAVVVGVDGSPSSLAALAHAFARAERDQVPLRVVRVVRARTEPDSGGREEAVDRAEAELLRSAAELCARHPRVEAEFTTTLGRPLGTLLREAAGARCLVVGARGRGGFRGLLLGSVSHALVEHTGCPLIVVPAVEAG